MKTLRIDNETHRMITNKIDELKTPYGVHVTIESIVISVLRNGLPNYTIVKSN